MLPKTILFANSTLQSCGKSLLQVQQLETVALQGRLEEPLPQLPRQLKEPIPQLPLPQLPLPQLPLPQLPLPQLPLPQEPLPQLPLPQLAPAMAGLFWRILQALPLEPLPQLLLQLGTCPPR